MKKTVSFFLFLVLLCNSASLLAQTPTEEIKTESDKFLDSFYESLKQKGIENYDLALVALEKCAQLKPNEAAVFSEIGKNLLALKKYDLAYQSFEKATKIDPKNKWFWVGMYDASYQNKEFEKAIVTVNTLITFDEIYKEDLTTLYMSTKQYEKALALINELNDKIGETNRRDNYKRIILSQGKYQNAEIENLKVLIDKNPKEESNYIMLIKLYSDNNDAEKSLETIKKLEAEIPTSEWAQVGLFKYYLDRKEALKAIRSMNIVFGSDKIDDKIKHRILNEFLLFVNSNPEYAPDLEKVIRYFDKGTDVDVAKEIGKYYHTKKQFDKAIYYYEQALKTDTSDDVATQLLLLQAYVDAKQFDVAAKKSSTMIDTYPAQPQFYYFAGMANNQLQQFKKAKDFLEMGMDFVVNDLPLEINFNLQLGEAYNGLGDFQKKEQYFSKANQLVKNKK